MKASISTLHHQRTDWLRETDFYKQELGILQKRLEEVAAKNTSQDIIAQVEHFQNKFIITKEQLDILRHDIKVDEQNIQGTACEMPQHLHQKFLNDDDKFKPRVKAFTSGFADLRYELNTFLSKVL